jgi:hypothetical protein
MIPVSMTLEKGVYMWLHLRLNSLIADAAIMVLLVVSGSMLFSCGGDFLPTIPTQPSTQPPTPPPTQPPAPPPTPPTSTDRPQVEFKRGNDPFGSSYSCAAQTVGPNWKSKWTIITVNNTTNTGVKLGRWAFGTLEPSCTPTVGPRSGAKDIIITEDGEDYLPPGQSAEWRFRIDMAALTVDDKFLCGNVQFAVGITYRDDRPFWNLRDRMINTGSDKCGPPPPPQCYLDLDVTTRLESNGNTTVIVRTSSSHPGQMTIDGDNATFPAGQSTQEFGPFNCEEESVTVSAWTECDNASETVQIYPCEE